jgi:hypothetical protein
MLFVKKGRSFTSFFTAETVLIAIMRAAGAAMHASVTFLLNGIARIVQGITGIR